jgi:hypothetical protein
MKTILTVLLLSGAGTLSSQTQSVSPLTSTEPAIVWRGANDRVWERVQYEPGSFGHPLPRVHRWVELASGLHFADPQTGQWTDSDDSFQITPEGYAVALRCQHKLIVSPSLDDTNGVLDCQAPDGARIRTAIIGILLFDPFSGKSLQVGAVKSCPGLQTATNEITFLDAFQGLKGSVRIHNERGRYHQEVLLSEKLTPSQITRLGFSPDSVRIEIWTEMLESPNPAVQAVVLSTVTDPATRAAMADPDTIDESLDFSALKMANGAAFLEGQPSQTAPVFKRWLDDPASGKRYLIEGCNYGQLLPLLTSLPESTLAGYTPKPPGKTLLAEGRSLGNARPNASKATFASTKVSALDFEPRVSVRTPPERLAPSARHSSYHIAKLDPAKVGPAVPQLNWDYTMLSGVVTGYCFRGDLTYYISAPVTLAGTNIWEGNAVLKFARNAFLTIYAGPPAPAAIFTSAAYKPLIFTGIDDSSVGENIGSGNPSGYYATFALNFGGVSFTPEIPYARFAYAATALSLGGVSANVSGAQFLNCQQAVSAGGSTLRLRNSLFANNKTNLLFASGVTGTAENVTFSGSAYLASGPAGAGNSLALTNCILANITNNSDGGFSAGGDFNGFYNASPFGTATFTTDSSPFVSAGFGRFYLAPGSNFRYVASTNVSTNVLAALRQSTTQPPLVYSNLTISSDGAFAPQAQRETGQLDLGYAYPPLDHLFGGVLAATNLTFAPGTAAGWFVANGSALRLSNTVSATFSGTATAPDYWVRRGTVQEGYPGLTESWVPGGISGSAWPDFTQAPQVNMRFTRLSLPGNDSTHMRDNSGYLVVRARDCEFWGGSLGGYASQLCYTNCLFDRATLWTSWDGAPTTNCNLVLRNTTWHGGSLGPTRGSGGPWPQWVILDSAFDSPTYSFSDAASGNTNYTHFDYNAFISGQPRLSPAGSNDVLVTNSFNWQTSWFGSYYSATNSTLIDAGSLTNAGLIGLYHYTIQTNQVKEANSRLDISYHYTAANTNGLPIDTDGDGIPDYLEDANGNGVVDQGETDWTSYNSPNGLTTTNGLQVFTPLKP